MIDPSWLENDPHFLNVGEETFKAHAKTELLVLIFVVGLVSAQSSQNWEVRRSHKRKQPPCANYPLERSQDSSQDELVQDR